MKRITLETMIGKAKEGKLDVADLPDEVLSAALDGAIETIKTAKRQSDLGKVSFLPGASLVKAKGTPYGVCSAIAERARKVKQAVRYGVSSGDVVRIDLVQLGTIRNWGQVEVFSRLCKAMDNALFDLETRETLSSKAAAVRAIARVLTVKGSLSKRFTGGKGASPCPEAVALANAARNGGKEAIESLLSDWIAEYQEAAETVKTESLQTIGEAMLQTA